MGYRPTAVRRPVPLGLLARSIQMRLEPLSFIRSTHTNFKITLLKMQSVNENTNLGHLWNRMKSCDIGSGKCSQHRHCARARKAAPARRPPERTDLHLAAVGIWQSVSGQDRVSEKLRFSTWTAFPLCARVWGCILAAAGVVSPKKKWSVFKA